MIDPPELRPPVGLWLNMMNVEIIVVDAVTNGGGSTGEHAPTTAAISRMVTLAAGMRSRFDGVAAYADLHTLAASVHEAAMLFKASPSAEAFADVRAAFAGLVVAGNAAVMPPGAPATLSIIGS